MGDNLDFEIHNLTGSVGLYLGQIILKLWMEGSDEAYELEETHTKAAASEQRTSSCIV